MQVRLENLEGLTKKLHVDIPEDKIAGDYNKRLNNTARTARIPGFRPGKAPMKIVAQKFGQRIRSEVIGDLIQSSLYDAIMEKQLRPVGSPKIDPVQSGGSAGFSYIAEFEVYPDVVLPEFEEIVIKKPMATVRDEDVDNMIETLRKRYAEWNEVDRAATAEDLVVIDLVTTVDGDEIEGGVLKEFMVELSEKRMIPGFEQALVGVSAGDNKVFKLPFPENYSAPNLAGKEAEFTVDIKKVEAASLPTPDDKFAESLGVTEGGLDELKSQVRNNIERELEEALNTKLKSRVMEVLMEKTPIELPEALVAEEAKRAMESKALEMQHSNLKEEADQLEIGQFIEQARIGVGLRLLMVEIIKKKQIKASTEGISKRIAKIAETYQDPDMVVKWYYENEERLQEIESRVLEDEMVEWILQNAKVETEELNFGDIMRPK